METRAAALLMCSVCLEGHNLKENPLVGCCGKRCGVTLHKGTHLN